MWIPFWTIDVCHVVLSLLLHSINRTEEGKGERMREKCTSKQHWLKASMGNGMNLFDLLSRCCVAIVESVSSMHSFAHICFSFNLPSSFFLSFCSWFIPPAPFPSPIRSNKTEFNSIFNKRFYYTFYSFYWVDSKRFRTIFYTKQAFELFYASCCLADVLLQWTISSSFSTDCNVVVVVVLFVLGVAVVDVSFLFIITFCFCCFGLFWSFMWVCVFVHCYRFL